MKTQLIEIQCFGPIISFVGLNDYSNICLEQYETYQKMSFRNRWQVLGATKVVDMSIPIAGGRGLRASIKEVKVDYSGRWQAEHWRTLESCYNGSPFFFYYAPSLKALLQERPVFLFDYARTTLEWVLKQLRWHGVVTTSHQYTQPGATIGEMVDLRNRFLPKNRKDFMLPEYQQVFGSQFESNLSILDLLFNLGPEAASYLVHAGKKG